MASASSSPLAPCDLSSRLFSEGGKEILSYNIPAKPAVPHDVAAVPLSVALLYNVASVPSPEATPHNSTAESRGEALLKNATIMPAATEALESKAIPIPRKEAMPNDLSPIAMPVRSEALSHNPSPASSPPLLVQPMENLYAASPPPFLTKIYDMIEDVATNSVVSWSSGNNSFIVWNLSEFSQSLLPRYFKHNNFSSFVRQLNTYGFKKVNCDRLEFAHEAFIRGQKHLLRDIHRRKPVVQAVKPNQPRQQLDNQSPAVVSGPLIEPCVEVGKLCLEDEIERLKRDKSNLAAEVLRLWQQQQSSENEIRAMAERVQAAEKRQEQMMNFLAKAIKSPSFLAHLMQQSESFQINYEGRKKRHLTSGTEEPNDLLGLSALQEPQALTETGKESAAIQREIQRPSGSTKKDDQMLIKGASGLEELYHAGRFDMPSKEVQLCAAARVEQVMEAPPALSSGIASLISEAMEYIDNVSIDRNLAIDSRLDRPLFSQLEGSCSDVDLDFDLQDFIEEMDPVEENDSSAKHNLGDFTRRLQESGVCHDSSFATSEDDHAVDSIACGTDHMSQAWVDLNLVSERNDSHKDVVTN